MVRPPGQPPTLGDSTNGLHGSEILRANRRDLYPLGPGRVFRDDGCSTAVCYRASIGDRTTTKRLSGLQEKWSTVSQNRLDWVDTAKAISIILVVVLHLRDQLEQFSLQSPQLDFFTDVSANLRMPMFFAVAGLFASKWLNKSWRELTRGKLALLVWVFLMWQPVVFAYRLLNHWVLDGLSWQYVGEQAVRVLVSPHQAER